MTVSIGLLRTAHLVLFEILPKEQQNLVLVSLLTRVGDEVVTPQDVMSMPARDYLEILSEITSQLAK